MALTKNMLIPLEIESLSSDEMCIRDSLCAAFRNAARRFRLSTQKTSNCKKIPGVRRGFFLTHAVPENAPPEEPWSERSAHT